MVTLDTFPTELLLNIASFLPGMVNGPPLPPRLTDDDPRPLPIVELTLVNRRLYSIFDPILWRCDPDLRRSDPDQAGAAIGWAVERDRIDILEKALKYKVHLGSAAASDPIHKAAKGSGIALTWLLDHGVPVDGRGGSADNATGSSLSQENDFVDIDLSPLYTALHYDNETTATILLSRNARYHFNDPDPNDPDLSVIFLGRFMKSALHWALRDGYHTVSRYLIEARRADVNEIITCPVRLPSRTTVCTPLQVAVSGFRANNNQVIQMLLDHGADINAESRPDLIPPLILALRRRNLDYARVLLNAGAKINPRNTDVPSPLMACIENTYPMRPCFNELAGMVMQKLIERGADLNDSFHGETPLTTAVRKDIRFLRILLKAGADFSKPRVSDGRTPAELVSMWIESNDEYMPDELSEKRDLLAAADAGIDTLNGSSDDGIGGWDLGLENPYWRRNGQMYYLQDLVYST
ncbi:ankyrin repeat-containing domain protein [Hypoxylon sp. FL1150]|nr:ankyrin repeat-containing domain protein [Hypoxylon sp. FL1150]